MSSDLLFYLVLDCNFNAGEAANCVLPRLSRKYMGAPIYVHTHRYMIDNRLFSMKQILINQRTVTKEGAKLEISTFH